MAHVEGVHHVGLTVSDVERSSAFYCKYFDLEELGRFRSRVRRSRARWRCREPTWCAHCSEQRIARRSSS